MFGIIKKNLGPYIIFPLFTMVYPVSYALTSRVNNPLAIEEVILPRVHRQGSGRADPGGTGVARIIGAGVLRIFGFLALADREVKEGRCEIGL
ncbi:MAG: hypothetical protein JXB45_07550 [Candidatus Krumholzibacteriota bacterium]|nr:hypothetical protein [Candidatus Krumholzibacteriota bacterium]